jgi:hypothetical protein
MSELRIQIALITALVFYIAFMADKILRAIGEVAKRLPPEAK